MNTALPQKFPFILDRNLAKANCTENRVCTSCDIVVLGANLNYLHNAKFVYCIYTLYLNYFIPDHVFNHCILKHFSTCIK